MSTPTDRHENMNRRKDGNPGEPESVEGHCDIFVADPATLDGGLVEFKIGGETVTEIDKRGKINLVVIGTNSNGGGTGYDLEIRPVKSDGTVCTDAATTITVADGDDGQVFDEVLGTGRFAVYLGSDPGTDLRVELHIC